MKLKWTLLALASLAATAPVCAQDTPPPAGIDDSVWQRFIASAAPASMESGDGMLFYDFATRCAAHYGDAAGWQLSAGIGETHAIELDRLLQEGYDDIGALRTGQWTAAGNCADRISAAYGSEFTRQAAQVGPIARHGIAVLRGAAIDGPDATEHPEDVVLTKEARDAVAKHISKPILLGLRSNSERVILILGEPLSSYRWFAQYRKLADGSWRYEGAYDASYLR
jgi:hypothetical protein